MRSPKRRRPPRRSFDTSSSPAKLSRAADRVSYEGSPEHKVGLTWLGRGRLRSDATPCPRDLNDPGVLTVWLAEAIRAGHCSAHWEDEFPRYAWARRDGNVYEARLINRGAGTYKGYPLNSDEIPPELP